MMVGGEGRVESVKKKGRRGSDMKGENRDKNEGPEFERRRGREGVMKKGRRGSKSGEGRERGE